MTERMKKVFTVIKIISQMTKCIKAEGSHIMEHVSIISVPLQYAHPHTTGIQSLAVRLLRLDRFDQYTQDIHL